MRGLKEKIIVISGGCGDLGSATAKRLGEEGARVVLLDVVDEKIGMERAQSVGATFVRCDQSERAQIDATLQAIVEKFGRLDVVIANAAMVHRALFQDITSNSWDDYLRVNLSGCFHFAQSAVRLMLAQPLDERGVRGKVLFTSSWTAQHPLPGNVPYVVTKSAVESLARAMAQELAHHGLRVNALAPGLVYAGLTKKLCDETEGLREALLDMVPLGELGTSEQVADAFAWLCSADSDYMTGQIVTVDGGCAVIKRALPDT